MFQVPREERENHIKYAKDRKEMQPFQFAFLFLLTLELPPPPVLSINWYLLIHPGLSTFSFNQLHTSFSILFFPTYTSMEKLLGMSQFILNLPLFKLSYLSPHCWKGSGMVCERGNNRTAVIKLHT